MAVNLENEILALRGRRTGTMRVNRRKVYWGDKLGRSMVLQSWQIHHGSSNLEGHCLALEQQLRDVREGLHSVDRDGLKAAREEAAELTASLLDLPPPEIALLEVAAAAAAAASSEPTGGCALGVAAPGTACSHSAQGERWQSVHQRGAGTLRCMHGWILL